MFEKQKTNTSVNEAYIKPRNTDELLTKKKKISSKKLPIGIGIGILLTLVTIVLQCIAFFTPHWKEISPNTHSLYVDGVDALIRTEVLHYFNTIHRDTGLSYGLFQRCEYGLSNSSILNNQLDLSDFVANKGRKKCTKNYLPSYRDEYFNECHSLPYYRFCTKASEKNFDINNDYLRATFDISSSRTNSKKRFSCDCSYPPYVALCHIIGVLAFIFLFLTSLLFSLFPFCTDPHYRLKIKCFGLLSSVLSIVFLMFNLIIISQHLEYESIEYLIAIQKHYKSNQIYKLSQDTKTAIDRFLSSINIRTGYSTIIAWLAFFLSIINAILLLATCKISHNTVETETRVSLISSHNEDHPTLLKFTSIPNDHHSPPPPTPPPLPVLRSHEETTSSPRNLQNEKYQPLRIRIEDEV